MSKILPQKNSLKKTGFDINRDGFNYRGECFQFDDITNLTRYKVNIETTVVATGIDYTDEISIVIVVKDGRKLIVSEQSTMFHTSDTEIVAKIDRMYDALRVTTFEIRLEPFINQINKFGVFHWFGWEFSTKDQTIKLIKKNKIYSISDVTFRRSYGNIVVAQRNTTTSLFVKFMRYFFGTNQPESLYTLQDEDVLLYLLKEYFKVYW